MWTLLKRFLPDIPVAFWLGIAVLAALLLYHFAALDHVREQTRAQLKADIAAAAAKNNGVADSRTREVLACRGTWNRETGRCDR